jgi:hypothetical protein
LVFWLHTPVREGVDRERDRVGLAVRALLHVARDILVSAGNADIGLGDQIVEQAPRARRAERARSDLPQLRDIGLLAGTGALLNGVGISLRFARF